MNLIFNIDEFQPLRRKIDVENYLIVAPQMNDVYEILTVGLRHSTIYKPGNVLWAAFSMAAYTLATKHPEERFAELLQLLEANCEKDVRDLVLGTLWVLLVLYRSPDTLTDTKIRLMTQLIKIELDDCQSTLLDPLVQLANKYFLHSVHANLDFKSHEGFIIETDEPSNVLPMSERTDEQLLCLEKARKRLQFLSGISTKSHLPFMKSGEYDALVHYVEHFVLYGEIPHGIQKIDAKVNDKRFLSFTFHCIFSDLKTSVTNHTAKEWVELLFAIFSNFDEVSQKTYKSKFCDKPKDYEEIVAQIEKNILEETKSQAS